MRGIKIVPAAITLALVASSTSAFAGNSRVDSRALDVKPAAASSNSNSGNGGPSGRALAVLTDLNERGIISDRVFAIITRVHGGGPASR